MSPSRLINTLIFINGAVFIAWQFDPLVVFMANNFLVSWDSLAEGRVWTLITSVFSHNMLFHLLINMFVLRSFGPILEKVLGAKSFLQFYFIAGIISSLSHAVVSNYIMNSPDLPALGASGAIAGIILVFSLLFPKERLLLFGIIPLPAIFGAIAFVGLDIWGLLAQSQGGGLPIGHGAHLGGAFTGVIYYFVFLRKRFFTGAPFAE
jgi:membrane associated rhomboid family serine protease